jgi:acetolactate synthase small subunit
MSYFRREVMLQLISILVENKPGALMRVVGVLSARGYNIESLTVARTLDPELSRMSIVVDVEPNQCTQVIKQINKLINVLQAVDLTDAAAVQRELALIRIRAEGGSSKCHPEGSRDFRGTGSRQLGRGICARSHGRSRKDRDVYPRYRTLR